VLVFTHTMPGEGGVCGVTAGVLLEVVDFAVVEVGGVALAVVFVGAAGVEGVVAGVGVFAEVVVAVDAFEPVVVEVPEVPPDDLLDLDFEGFLFGVEVLFDVEVLDEVEVLEDPVGACDLISFGETRISSSANKTGGTTLLRRGKVILSVS
jgi:hypothetical protein